MKEKIKKLNDKIALWLTVRFGSMWLFYAFVLCGCLPLLANFHSHQDVFLYWSNFIQLISLPLIMVGTNLLSKDAQDRSKIDHETLAKSYKEQKELDKKVSDALETIQSVLDDTNKQNEEPEIKIKYYFLKQANLKNKCKSRKKIE